MWDSHNGAGSELPSGVWEQGYHMIGFWRYFPVCSAHLHTTIVMNESGHGLITKVMRLAVAMPFWSMKSTRLRVAFYRYLAKKNFGKSLFILPERCLSTNILSVIYSLTKISPVGFSLRKVLPVRFSSVEIRLKS